MRNWSITTLSHAEIVSLDAPTFEDAYAAAVQVWDALAKTPVDYGETMDQHCDGILLWEDPNLDGNWILRLQIDYTTHER